MAEFRFYEELNDFLPLAKRKRALRYEFRGHPGIKDPIEAFGVPHTEVDLIVVNGESVGFDYPLQSGDRVAVYPVFESFDISPLVKLRDRPLRQTAFVVDVNLGKLARRLRMLGLDVLYHNRYRDDEIAAIAASEHRIVLTRDRRLLFIKRITHGYWVRAVNPDEQVREVLTRFDLHRQVKPFRRCIDCNGLLRPVAKADVSTNWSRRPSSITRISSAAEFAARSIGKARTSKTCASGTSTPCNGRRPMRHRRFLRHQPGCFWEFSHVEGKMQRVVAIRYTQASIGDGDEPPRSQ